MVKKPENGITIEPALDVRKLITELEATNSGVDFLARKEVILHFLRAYDKGRGS